MSVPSTFLYRQGGDFPWHGSGTVIPAGVAPSAAIARDPLLGSTVSVRPLQFPCSDGSMADAPFNVVVRDHDDKAIGNRSVSDRYTPAQPRDKGELLDRISAEFGAQFDVAGLLKDGAIWWTQAEFGQPLKLHGEDRVHARFTVFDSFDGSYPLAAGLASTRAVCSNTIAHALGEAKGASYYRPIRHVGDVAAKLRSAGDAFAAAVKGWEKFGEFARAASDFAISKAQAREIIVDLVPLPADKDANTTRADNKREAIWLAFGAGRGNNGQTAWDLYNGVTQYVTWDAPVKGGAENRWQSALLGDGADLAAQAEQSLRVVLGM